MSHHCPTLNAMYQKKNIIHCCERKITGRYIQSLNDVFSWRISVNIDNFKYGLYVGMNLRIFRSFKKLEFEDTKKVSIFENVNNEDFGFSFLLLYFHCSRNYSRHCGGGARCLTV